MLYKLDEHNPGQLFPDPSRAETEPNGLLAVGGDLSPERLINAYRRGIFPWFSEDQPILWWSPDPRMVLLPSELKISRSLKKTLRRGHLKVSVDQAFTDVVQACSEPRRGEPGTWLLPEMVDAYTKLHQQGLAHSVEIWLEDELAGGLYGISMGEVFFGESMFSKVTDASKAALVMLCRMAPELEIKLIDCQVYTEHLESLGAKLIPRNDFQRIVDNGVKQSTPRASSWPRSKTETIYLAG